MYYIEFDNKITQKGQRGEPVLTMGLVTSIRPAGPLDTDGCKISISLGEFNGVDLTVPFAYVDVRNLLIEAAKGNRPLNMRDENMRSIAAQIDARKRFG